MSKTYEDGLNEAWLAAIKIVCLPSAGGYSASELMDIFGGPDISSSHLLKHNTCAEVIAKIKEYENRIEVGDEVKKGEIKGVVIDVGSPASMSTVWWQDGIVSGWARASLKKTGRHFPEIAEVLKQMQEDDE